MSVLVLAITLLGCGADETLLAVDVRTELAPAVDFVSVRVDLVEARSDGGSMLRSGERVARAGEDWRTGFRISEFTLPRGGDWLVRGELRDGAGTTVASGSVRIGITEGRAHTATLTLTRACAGDVCGDGGIDGGADASVPLDAPSDAPPDAALDAGDAGPACAQPIPFAPRIACAESTRMCGFMCSDQACIQACIDADPDPAGCFDCIDDALQSCASERRCQTEWVAYSCCRAAFCGPSPSADCLASACPDERVGWMVCYGDDGTGITCAGTTLMCFP